MISAIHKHRRRSLGVICFLLIIVILLFGLPLLGTGAKPCAISEQGIMDLGKCELNEIGTVELDGLWEYTPNQLLWPESKVSNPVYVQIPHQWQANGRSLFQEDVVNYATYRITLKLPSGYQNYGIRVSNVKTASRLYVDGKLLGSRGQIGTSREKSIPNNRPYTVYFSPHKEEVELVLQASNFHFYANTGISERIFLGIAESIQTMEKHNGFMDVTLISCLLFMGIYFLGENFYRRDQGSIAFFPLFCFSGALYFACHGEKLILEFVAGISYEWVTKLQVISSTGVGYFFLAHTYIQLKVYSSVKLVKLSGIVSILIVSFVLFTPMSIYTKFMLYFIILQIVGLLYIIFISWRALLYRMTGSAYIFVSVMSAIQVIGLMVSRTGWIGPVSSVLPLGIPIFMLAQGLFFSSRFTSAYHQIKQLSEQLMAKMKGQEQFLVRTSHELKTPLNAIINISESMLEGAGGKLNASQRADMRLVNGTARGLSYLVKDILDSEQIKNRRIRLHPRSLDVYDIVAFVIDVFQRLNRNSEVDVRNEVKAGIHYVVGDENRVTQILYNLLDNALKHTEAGHITVSCVSNEGWEQITVADTGAGIEAQYLDRIFMDYQQIDSSSLTDTSGIGIGLPITKQLVEMQGGRMEVQSKIGEGSNFIFTLPAVKLEGQPTAEREEIIGLSEQPEAAGGASHKSGGSREARDISNKDVLGEQCLASADIDFRYIEELDVGPEERAVLSPTGQEQGRILLVDDNYASLKALANLLELEGYTCELARSGKTALSLLEHGNRFNLCIMDVMMPTMSGFDLCRVIRQMYSPLDLPVLMATAGSNVHLNQIGFEAGANDFIHKPYDWTDLKGRVKTLVQLKETVLQLVHSERDMLRAQIKPHFLFNSINTILWMSKRDSDETRKLLHALSDFLRGSFDFDNQEIEVPFADELRIIEAYLSLERARFGSRLKVEYNLEERNFAVPPLLLQPIVENAVRHGIMEKVEGGTIVITSRRVEMWIELSVSDDGVGMDIDRIDLDKKVHGAFLFGDKRGGIGLSNINRRIRSLYGTSLSIADREGGGTVVTMRIRAGDDDHDLSNSRR
ncbi:ATP-binding protein [Paenibacillus sp. UMB4589-SE434]|uniref:hybrid sensor histidine kinase/response regulator n=1 Tax=Paenibacillus sp. UMB4589-SE434 TaxID=3046314 RepID=UPI002551539F|nr:ATP-binding protein [Paenibacillus sp. UMB4589-SE434]MDK8181414.1 ATP-binding protein [Paenibacillus sp. UMB4589-SE434]